MAFSESRFLTTIWQLNLKDSWKLISAQNGKNYFYWCFNWMCNDSENSEFHGTIPRKSYFKIVDKAGVFFCCWHSFPSLSSLHLVSCFDTSAKRQLYQKLGKLPCCCTSLTRQIKCFLQPAGPQEAVLGRWSSLAQSLAATPGRRETFAFIEDAFWKAVRKRCSCLSLNSCQCVKAEPLNLGQKNLNLSAYFPLNSACSKCYQIDPLKVLLFAWLPVRLKQ